MQQKIIDQAYRLMASCGISLEDLNEGLESGLLRIIRCAGEAEPMEEGISREALNECYRLRRNCEHTYDRICAYRDMATSTTSRPTKAPARSGTSDKIGDAVPEYIELMEQMREELSELAPRAAEVNAAIQSLTNAAQRDVMALHYLDGLGWKEVATKMGYSIQNCFVLHAHAMEALGIRMRKV